MTEKIMLVRKLRWGAYLAVLAACLATGESLRQSPHAEESTPAIPMRNRPELAHYHAQMKRLISLHAKLPKPAKGEWLAEYFEGGQTFDQYVASRSEPVSDLYSEIQVLPLGEFTPTQKKLLQQTGEFLELYFGLPVRMLDSQPLDDVPAEAQRRREDGSRQWKTRHLLFDVLKPQRSDDAAALLGFVADDLWPGNDWNYVFGEASPMERVGVWSLARNGDPDESEAAYRLCLLRTLRTAVHETGHMLGIPHCIAYSCCMNGSNHRAEADRKPLEYCPECQAKLWWTCRVDPVKRYDGLIPFAESAGLVKEARYWKAALARLSATNAKSR